MFEKVKKFVKEHKTEFIIGGCALLAGVGGGYYIYFKYGKKEPPVQANFVVSRYVKDDLPKPNWGIHYDIQEHWMDPSSGCPMMILDTYLPCLGEFGEKLINECCANPDIPVGIIMTYGNN